MAVQTGNSYAGKTWPGKKYSWRKRIGSIQPYLVFLEGHGHKNHCELGNRSSGLRAPLHYLARVALVKHHDGAPPPMLQSTMSPCLQFLPPSRISPTAQVHPNPGTLSL